MKIKVYANGILLLILLLVYLSFAACTKPKKDVRTTPDNSVHVKKDIIERSTEILGEMRQASGKSKETNIIKKIEESSYIITSKPQLSITPGKKSMILDAGKSHEIVVYLENHGNAEGKNVKIDITGFKGRGILKSNETLSKSINAILPGQKEKVVFPVKINPEIEDSTLFLKIFIVEGESDKPSVLKIKVTCRSREERLYIDIIKKSRSKIESRIAKCVEYIKEYGNGPHTPKVKNLLENLRWVKVQRIYQQAVAKKDVRQETIAEIESTYLIYYGLEGRYSEFVVRMFYELQDFQKACAVDTYEEYRKFKKKHKKSPFFQIAATRGTLAYWKQREKKDVGNPHIWCQVAQALVEEKGVLGYREAKEYFLKTIQKEPNDEAAYIGIGKIMIAWKNYQDSVEYLEERRPRELNHYKIFYYLGYAYEQLENHNEAIEYYSRAIKNLEAGINTIDKLKKQTDYLECLYYRALLYRVRLDLRQAIKDFEKIVEIAPESQMAKDAKVYLKEIRK